MLKADYNTPDLPMEQRIEALKEEIFNADFDLRNYRTTLTRTALVALLHYKEYLEDTLVAFEMDEPIPSFMTTEEEYLKELSENEK